MQYRIRFEPEQAKVLESLMEGLYMRAFDMSPALRAVTEVYLADQRGLFNGDHNWAPLTPGTIQTKERTGHMQMMIGKTGALKGSLTLRAGSNKFASTMSNNIFAVLGTHAPHAHLQALGTAERERNKKATGRTGAVTARSMAFVNPLMVKEFYGILESYLVNGVVGTGAEVGGAGAANTIDLSGFDQNLGI